jgi:hypothetical protein
MGDELGLLLGEPLGSALGAELGDRLGGMHQAEPQFSAVGTWQKALVTHSVQCSVELGPARATLSVPVLGEALGVELGAPLGRQAGTAGELLGPALGSGTRRRGWGLH